MSTIHDDPRPRPAPAPAPAPATATRATLARLLAAWPFVALALLVAIAGWRYAGDATPAASAGRAEVAERRFEQATLRVPRTWVTLDRSADHVTWGEPGRAHTVTLSRVEASAAPLPAVVASLLEESRAAMPRARSTGAPRQLELEGPAPRDDAAMLARFRIETRDAPPLDVAQVWRRDSRAGLDLVATWTSTDGRWPVEPRDGIPRAS